MSNPASELLIQDRIPVYPRSVKGQFRNIKWIILGIAYSVYFLLPWLRWTREVGPDQAILFDIVARRFYLFDLVLHPQDLIWLAAFLIIAALFLFFVTSILGRVFCGYFCFQTLWTDVYLQIERWVQGDRVAHIRLDKSPWSFNKFYRKLLTHLLWLLVAFITGLTFTLYWDNAPQLITEFFTGEAPFPAYATTLFLTATTYVMAGMAREQVCTHMCPYSRFQSVMFDNDTRIVVYDERRGEASAGRHKIARELKTQVQREAAGFGDCIDCGYCVQVCPVGIDIRNGLQIQCVSCALCIDACDTMMGSLGWDKGLIRYSSEKQLDGLQSKIFRPKSIGYGVILLAAIVALFWGIGNQAVIDMSVVQVRQPLFVRLSDGRIQNSYVIHIENKTNKPIVLRVVMDGLEGAELDLGKLTSITSPPQRSLKIQAHVRWEPEQAIKGARSFKVRLISQQNENIGVLSANTSFFIPGKP